MDAIICHEFGCENIIDAEVMEYGKDYYVLINLCDLDPDEPFTAKYIFDKGLVGIFCKDCGIVCLAEAQANGFEVLSRRQDD